MLGSTYSTVKAAVIERLLDNEDLGDVEILPAPPISAEDLMGQSGSGKSIWLADSEGSYENVVLCGAGRLDLEEVYDLTVVFQALPVDTDDDQTVTDRRIDELLGAFLTDMASDPTFGIAASDDLPLVYCTISHGSFKRFTGPFTAGVLFPARCELALAVEARISFT